MKLKDSGIVITMNLKDIVFLKTDVDKLKRIVTGISIRENCVSYELAQGAAVSWHYGFEIDHKIKEQYIGFKQSI